MSNNDCYQYPILPDVVAAVRNFKGKRLQGLAWKYLDTDFSKLRTGRDFDKLKAGFAALTFILAKTHPDMIPGLKLHYDVVRDMHRDAKGRDKKQHLVDRIMKLANPAPGKRHEVRDMLETFLSEGK